MACFTIDEIVAATNGILLWGDSRIQVEGVSTDTRKIEPSQLFVPLIGQNFDGHRFIPQAVEKGAAAIIAQHQNIDCPIDIPVILVRNTLEAYQNLAAYHRKRFDIPIIAVTGSTGKTTTKDMIYYVLSRRYRVLRTEGNLNNEIGLPYTLLQLDNHHEIAVVEMGMSGFGEIQRMAEIALPQVGVITNIGVSHIEKLGSRENILKAKMEIFHLFTKDSMAILNGDDELLQTIKESLTFPAQYFGTWEKARYRAQEIYVQGEDKLSYQLNMEGDRYPIEINVPGRHNIYNSLAAIAVGRLLGMEMEEIQMGLSDFKPGSMRLNISINPTRGIKMINDAYNASPDSMKAALAILSESKGVRKIAVLGDMLEMGSYSEKAHRDVGEVVTEYKIDILITRGEDSRLIGEQARASGMNGKNIYHCTCNKDVIDLLSTMVQREDTILVKGSRGMKMEEIAKYLEMGMK